jgi:single-strand DNA-binding protein
MINATIIGNLTRDPETRHVGDGTVTNFNIAVNRKVGTKEYVTFVGCALWGKRGESFAQYHRKGDKASVSGTLYNEDYQEKTYTKLDVNDWTFVKDKGGWACSRDGARVTDSPLPKRGPSGSDFGGLDAIQHDDIPF